MATQPVSNFQAPFRTPTYPIPTYPIEVEHRSEEPSPQKPAEQRLDSLPEAQPGMPEPQPAPFAVTPLKALTNPVNDQRLSLRSTLYTVRQTRIKLESDLEQVKAKEAELNQKLSKIDEYLQLCQMLTAMTTEVDPVVKSGYTPPEMLFTAQEALAILDAHPNRAFTAKALAQLAPEDKRSIAEKTAYNRLQYLMSRGQAYFIGNGQFQRNPPPPTPEPEPKPLESKPAPQIVVAPPAGKKKPSPAPNPTSLGAALGKTKVTKLVQEHMEKSKRVRTTTLGAALSKAGVAMV